MTCDDYANLRMMGQSQEAESAVPADQQAAFELSDLEKDYVLRSVVASLALDGITVTREVAERLLEQALKMPLPDFE